MEYVYYVTMLEDNSLIVRPSIGFVPEGTVGILPNGEDIRWVELVDNLETISVPVYDVDANGDIILDVNGSATQSLDVNGDPIFEDQIINYGKILAVNTTLKTSIQAQDASDAATKATNDKWSVMRDTRNSLLIETDYIIMPDYPMVDKTAYETYRQELRDLPATIVDIDSFSYPIKP